MATNIHSTAIVDPQAEIADGVEIGPFCCVGPRVSLDADVVLQSHVVIDGMTKVGARSTIYPFASIGLRPQDLKYAGEKSELTIGADNTIREYVTMNPGTEGGGMVTRVGDQCLFMAGSHVAHDCQVGDHVILANNATLAGHVTVGSYAIIGGLAAVHQFVRIGAYAMVGGMTGVEHDVIPYGSVVGERGRLSGLNLVGLKRGGVSKDRLHNMRAAFRLLFSSDNDATISERLEDVAARFHDEEEIMNIIRFMQAESGRGLTQPKPVNGG